jgi:hypothetical protein
MLQAASHARTTRARACNSYKASRSILAITGALLMLSVSRLDASTLSAQWSPNPESNIEGYLLSYGTQSHNYTTTFDVGNVTSYSFSVTAGQTYYFALQAYDVIGLVSPYSAEVVFTVAAGAPAIVNLSPATGSPGTSVTISGSNFGATQGANTVTFNAITATPTSWSSTTIVAPVPAVAVTGPVVVTAGGLQSNSVAFTVTGGSTRGPVVTSVSPGAGPVGTPVTITGTGFSAPQGTSTISFNGTKATPTTWSDTSIVVPVPAGATTGNVVVTVGGVASNGAAFTVSTSVPTITALSPQRGRTGTTVTISGTNFGASQGTSRVTFNGVAATPAGWSNSSITVAVPRSATSGPVVVTVGGVNSNGVTFTFKRGR